MSQNLPSKSKIDPKLRDRLLKESKNPFKGIRRSLWLVFFGSSFIGLFIMLLKLLSGDNVLLSDMSIQTVAFFLFGILLVKDRDRDVQTDENAN